MIYKRMQEVRLTVLRNPLDKSLGGIVDRLLNSDFGWWGNCESPKEGERCEDVLVQRRYDLAALYKFFMLWLKYAVGEMDGFIVYGP